MCSILDEVKKTEDETYNFVPFQLICIDIEILKKKGKLHIQVFEDDT